MIFCNCGGIFDSFEFKCKTCDSYLEYFNEPIIEWLVKNRKISIKNHKEFFYVFTRNNLDLKKRMKARKISFLYELHIATLLKLGYAKEYLSEIKNNADLFFKARSKFESIYELQKFLTPFFICLVGCLDSIAGELEIVLNPEVQFTINKARYQSLENKLKNFIPLRSLKKRINWLDEIIEFRNFFAHRGIINFLSCGAGEYTFFGKPRDYSAPAYNFPVYIGEKIKTYDRNGNVIYLDENGNLLRIEEKGTFHVVYEMNGIIMHSSLAEVIRKKLKIPIKELDKTFNMGAQIRSLYVNRSMVVLPTWKELRKSPIEEISEFQKKDVKEFCLMNYIKTRNFLGKIYEFLINEWHYR